MWTRGRRATAPNCARLGEGLHTTAGQRAAPDLDDEVVQTSPGGPQVGHHLVGQGLPTLDGQAVLVALAGEGQGAGVDLLAQPDVGRVAGHAGRAGAGDHVGPQVAEALDDDGVGVDRDEHPQAPVPGGGHHRRGQGRVPATGYGQVRAVLATGEAQAFGDFEVEEHPHEVPALVRTGDIAGLVLDPHAPAAPEAEALGQDRAAHERRGPEAVPVHGGDGIVELADQAEEVFVGHAAGHGPVVAVQEAPVPGERLGARLVVGGKAHRLRVEGPHEDMVDVTLAGAGAPEGVRASGVGRAPATGADETAGRLRHGTGTPLRELNSLIISSHTGTFWRSADQNEGWRRATKSSNERPCCSTQVK